MTSMNVSLPEAMKRWAEERVADGRYANVSDYVRALIREDQDRLVRLESLRAALIVGEESGPSGRSPESVIAAARAKARSALSRG